MTEEGDFPKTDDNLASSTKRLADWTFSLQGVGADLKSLVNEFKTFWRDRMASMSQQPVSDVPVGRVMSTTHPYNSPNESIHDNTAPIQTVRFTLPKSAREILVAIILSTSILGNVVMWVAYRDLKQVVDLDRYDDNTFINGRFADLAAQVRADHDLIQAYGLQKTLKEH